MRIQQLALTRYGHFSDKALNFEPPASGCDLHLIVGPNEAGKSTIREAICDLLYGFPLRSPMGFLHALSELEVSARISNGGESLAFTRLKKTKNDLRDADKAILSPDTLQPFIGNTDRALYERMFCFDRDRLQECARQMLDQNNDAGQILFESSAGIQGLHSYQKMLEEEAEKFYAPKAKSGRLFYDALNAYKDAAKSSRELAQDAAKYRQAKRDLAEAKADVEALMKEVSEQAKRRAMLERVRLSAPKLRRIEALEQEIAELGEVIVFPPNARELLSDTLGAIARETPALAREEEKLASLRSELEGLAKEAPFLAAAEMVQGFIKAASAASNHQEELQTQAKLISQAQKKIAGLCLRIGWDPEANQDPDYVLPRILAVKSLTNCAATILRLTEGLRKQDQEVTQLAQEQQSLKDEASEMAAQPLHPEIIQALKTGERALGKSADYLDAQSRQAHIEASIEQQLAYLAPWRGSIEDLQALTVLDEAAAADARNAKLSVQAKCTAGEDELEALSHNRDAVAYRIAHLRQDTPVISDEELAQLRQSRDSSLHRAFSDPSNAAAKAETLALVSSADEKADERYANTKASHELSEAIRNLARLDEQIHSRRTKLASLRDQLSETDVAWAQKMSAAGLAGIVIEQYGEWFSKRKAVLELHAKAQEYRATASRYGHERAQVREAIMRSVTKHGLTLEGVDKAPTTGEPGQQTPALEVLIPALADKVTQAEGAHARRAQMARELAKIEQRIGDLELALAHDREALSAAEKQWAAGLAKTGLAAESSPEMLDDILAIVATIDEHASDIRRRQHERVLLMESELAALEAGRRQLERDFDLSGAPADLAAFVGMLESRLEEEKLAFAQRQHLQREIDKAQRFIDETSRSIRQQRGTLAGLHQLADTATDEALQKALRLAGDVEEKQNEINKLKLDVNEVSSGLSMAEIEAEVASLEGEDVAAQALILDSESADLQARRDLALIKKNEAQKALDQMAGSDAAAAAESRRVAAAADIQEAIDQYLGLKTRARLLAWSIDWFRRERQGPILKASSELFGQLTNGAFERLSVDVSDTTAKLTAVRSTLGNTDVEGLSEGARDQLYLALRLAAVQQYVSTTTAMPFIADDLFMAFDDERAQAGFEALKGLSSKTQVLYFSHHRHLVPIAKSVLPDINIVDVF